MDAPCHHYYQHKSVAEQETPRRQLRSDPRRELAEQGEEAAAEWYRRRGAQILQRNVRYPVGEIDIIAREPSGEVVFIEVKTRRSEAFGAAESVGPRKFRRMRRAIARWVSEHPAPSVRIDVVSIVDGHLTVYQGVDDAAR